MPFLPPNQQRQSTEGYSTQKLVSTATSLEGSKKNFISFINGQRSTNPANLMKIGLVEY